MLDMSVTQDAKMVSTFNNMHTFILTLYLVCQKKFHDVLGVDSDWLGLDELVDVDFVVGVVVVVVDLGKRTHSPPDSVPRNTTKHYLVPFYPIVYK